MIKVTEPPQGSIVFAIPDNRSCIRNCVSLYLPAVELYDLVVSLSLKKRHSISCQKLHY